VTDPTALSRRCWPVPPSLPIISSTGLRGEHALSDRNATIAQRHHPSFPTPLIMKLAAPSAAFRAANFMINGVGEGKVEWVGPGCPAAVNGGAATDRAGVQATLALRTQAKLAVRTAELTNGPGGARCADPGGAHQTDRGGARCADPGGDGWAGRRTRAARAGADLGRGRRDGRTPRTSLAQLCDRSGGR
jgi:hypothetical protein